MLAMGELQSERVDEAIRAKEVMTASMIRVRDNAAIPSMWNVRCVVLYGLAEVQICSDMLAMRVKFRALMLTVVRSCYLCNLVKGGFYLFIWVKRISDGTSGMPQDRCPK